MKPLRLASSGVLITALTAGMTAGCDLQRAVDCTRLAPEVTSGAQALEQAVQNGDPAAFTDAADEVTADVGEIQTEVDDTDVVAAADSVLDAVANIREGVENGTAVDLSPLGDATAELSDVCTS